MKNRRKKSSGRCGELGARCLTWCSSKGHHCALYTIAGAVFGLLLGIGFFLFILLDMELDPVLTLILAVVTSLILAVGNALSDYVRCVSLLTLPAAFGRTGRGVLKAFALALVVSGPLANLATNAREVVRVFGCTAQLAYNLTRTKHQILLKPFQDALAGMRHDEQLVLDTLEAVQDVVDPLVQEVEGQEEVDRLRAESDYMDAAEGDSPRSREIEKKYLELGARRRSVGNGTEDEGEVYEMEYKRKVEYRCEGIVNQGTAKCRALFQNAYDSCYDKVSVVVAWLLCWPMKLTFMCNLVSVFGGKALCDPSHVVEPGFGEGYATVKNSKGLMSENLGNVKVKYVIKGAMPQVNATSAVEAAHAALADFNASKAWFDVISLAFKRLFALVFLMVVYKAAQYQDKYVTDIDFDNKYITAYFRKVDGRQQAAGHHSLLPLRKREARYFVDPTTWLPDRAAACRIVKLSMLLLVEMVPVTTFFALDMLLYEMLDIIASHAHVEFTQKGEHHMTVRVVGGGLVANLVRSMVRDLNVHQSIHVVHSNVTCLPRPALIARYYVLKVYGIYVLVWLLILLDGYTTRLHRAICALFHPKREKRRVLYLYNETLRRRARLNADTMAHMRQRAAQARLQMAANWFLSLRMRYPGSCGWLRLFPCARRECLVCREPEPARPRADSLECPHCLAVHCAPCWDEVGHVCYQCLQLKELHAMQDEEWGEDEEVET